MAAANPACIRAGGEICGLARMQRVYAGADRILVGFLKSVLEANGIPCIVRFDHLAGAAGELPPTEVWPELWVLNDEDERAAKTQIALAIGERTDSLASWACPRCGELIEGQFAACWRCAEEA